MTAAMPEPARLERIEALTAVAETEAAPPEVSDAMGLGWEWIGGSLVIWASKLDVLMYNRAFCIGQASPATSEELDAIGERLERERIPRWFVQPAPGARPDTLPALLESRGYARYNRWAKLARPLTDLPAIPNGVRVDCIGRDRADEIGRVMAEGFEMPEYMRAWEAALVERPGWHHYLASVDSEVAGCAALFMAEGLGSMCHAATLAPMRGRGVQGALIARRLADAAELGLTHVVTETAEDSATRDAPSYRNQLRHGYTLSYLRENWIHRSAESVGPS